MTRRKIKLSILLFVVRTAYFARWQCVNLMDVTFQLKTNG